MTPVGSHADPNALPSDNTSRDHAPIDPHDDLRYVVVEGVIGAGKTTLATILADHFDGKLVLERFEENPFLDRFYKNRERWAFQTQLSFLASRFQQQKLLQGPDLFHQMVVSDYSFDKDRIFAHLNLGGDELQLYETLFRLMEPNTPTPDLVVYLQSTPERLMQNIRKRGRSFEEDIEVSYIEALNDAYNYYFFRYAKSPLLVVNVAEIDFVENQDELELLVEQIATVRYRGTTYWNPTPSAPVQP